MRMTRIVAMIPLLFPPLAAASPVLVTGNWYIGDGETYNVNWSVNNGYDLQNGTLNILPGADIQSVSVAGYSFEPLVTMSGGQVDNGIWMYQGNLTVSGGLSHGWNSTSSATSAGNGAAIYYQSSAQITGGTFIGGNSPVAAGSGFVNAAANVDGKLFLSTLNISGGTFIGGTGSGGGVGGSTGYSLWSSADTTVTGGHFLSPIAIDSSTGGETAFLGTHLTYQNGILSGLLQNGDPIHVQIYPDFTTATVNASGTEVSFLPSSSTTPLPSPLPEPTSALIFGLLTTLGLTRRRSHRSR
jgi:hypothetical protein